MNNLTPNNWQEVKADLIARFNGKACNSEFTKLQNATTFHQLFSVVFENYQWLKDRDYQVAEIENITPFQYSSFMVWMLETYCLGKDVDSVVQAVIDLHKQGLNGVELTEKEWDAARDAAWAAAWAAAWDAAWAAAWDAARAARAAARDAAWAAAWAAAWDAARAAVSDAAWEQVTNKIIGIIYE
jgi:hypothetical protein